MSPRLEIPGDCPHSVYRQHYSERGLMSGDTICRHPDNDGCWCVVSTLSDSTCYSRLDTRELERRPLSEMVG